MDSVLKAEINHIMLFLFAEMKAFSDRTYRMLYVIEKPNDEGNVK
jgi:hypothetical protein